MRDEYGIKKIVKSLGEGPITGPRKRSIKSVLLSESLLNGEYKIPKNAEDLTEEELDLVRKNGSGVFLNGWVNIFKTYGYNQERWYDYNNDYHRLCGPALIDGDHKSYRLHGKHIPACDFMHAHTCPFDSLPLLLGGDLHAIAKYRLKTQGCRLLPTP